MNVKASERQCTLETRMRWAFIKVFRLLSVLKVLIGVSTFVNETPKGIVELTERVLGNSVFMTLNGRTRAARGDVVVALTVRERAGRGFVLSNASRQAKPVYAEGRIEAYGVTLYDTIRGYKQYGTGGESVPTNALFCFEFLVESVQVLDAQYGPTVRRIDFKLDQYEWHSIEQEEWENIGRRCYLLSEGSFVQRLADKKLRLRAVTGDGSLHACDVGLGSFHQHQDAAYCKGSMELFASSNGTRSVIICAAMRIFNVDCVHPLPVHTSLVAITQSVQTASKLTHHKRVQAQPSRRNAAIQTSSRRARSVTTQVNERSAAREDRGTQCTARWYRQQVERAVTEVVRRILASRRITPAITRVRDTERRSVPKRPNRPSIPARRAVVSVPVRRRAPRWIPAAGATNSIGFNVICRNQLIRTLDRIIAYKQKLSAQPVNTSASAAVPAIRRICRTSGQPNDKEGAPRGTVRYGKPKTDGDFDLVDRRRSGRPVEVDEERLNALIHQNPCQTARELANELQCDNSTVLRHLHTMGKVQKLGAWVPHVLSENNKTEQTVDSNAKWRVGKGSSEVGEVRPNETSRPASSTSSSSASKTSTSTGSTPKRSSSVRRHDDPSSSHRADRRSSSTGRASRTSTGTSRSSGSSEHSKLSSID